MPAPLLQQTAVTTLHLSARPTCSQPALFKWNNHKQSVFATEEAQCQQSDPVNYTDRLAR
jgi:hypothetical protein